jgi:shikimate kinase
MTLKLKRTPGLYLVGFMASGKTTIGKVLADHLGWPLYDIDSDIEVQEGMSVARIFDDRGEAAFRDLETNMIARRVRTVQAGMPSVIVLGGGAFVQPRNFELLENNGVTVWLDCPLEIVRQRLGDDVSSRPLARNPELLCRLYEDRRPLYSRADFRIDICEDDIDEVVNRILALPIF